MPIFAEKLGKDFDINNVFVCCVFGKDIFPIYQKILEAFQIPYAILCDEDAYSQANITKCTNKVILKPDFEGVLKRQGLGSLISEAQTKGGGSKPQKGRYIAENIEKESIPEEFEKIIHLVTELTKAQSS